MFTAYDVCKDNPQVKEDRTYPFGIGARRAADELRKLAAQIEAGQVILQRVKVMTVAEIEDFPMTYIKLKVYETK